MADRYNGWRNYETWNLKLWIDNDEGLSERWVEAAREAVDHTAADADSHTRKRNAAAELAEQLETETVEGAPAAGGFYGDILSAAIREVDYREIAAALIEDLVGYE